MLSNVTIRPLDDSDFTEFLEIQRIALEQSPELFGSDYDWFNSISLLSKEQRFEKYQNFPYAYLLGAVNADGSIVGMIGFSCDHHQTKLKHKGRVWGMYVLPEARGHGLATSLLTTAIDTARDVSGCELIQLAVSTQNRSAYELYLRLGFVVYGTEMHAMKVGDAYVDEYLMVKFLR